MSGKDSKEWGWKTKLPYPPDDDAGRTEEAFSNLKEEAEKMLKEKDTEIDEMKKQLEECTCSGDFALYPQGVKWPSHKLPTAHPDYKPKNDEEGIILTQEQIDRLVRLSKDGSFILKFIEAETKAKKDKSP